MLAKALEAARRSLQDVLDAKSDHMTFVHFRTRCEIPPSPPLAKGGMKMPPFVKGVARQRGGILVRDYANLLWFNLVRKTFQSRTMVPCRNLERQEPMDS